MLRDLSAPRNGVDKFEYHLLACHTWGVFFVVVQMMLRRFKARHSTYVPAVVLDMRGSFFSFCRNLLLSSSSTCWSFVRPMTFLDRPWSPVSPPPRPPPVHDLIFIAHTWYGSASSDCFSMSIELFPTDALAFSATQDICTENTFFGVEPTEIRPPPPMPAQQ